MSAFRTHGRGHLNGPVVVVGTGLLGTSIGLGLRGRGVAVFLSDPSPTNQAVAVDIGAGLPLARLDGEQPELVVVAAPPDVTADVVERALADYPGATVVDIASVKAGIQADLRERGADLGRYVGTHPMAGREKSGPVAARGELFTSMPWVLCPSAETQPQALQAARAGRGPGRRRLRIRGRGARRGGGARLACPAGGVLARGEPAAGHALHALSLAGNGLRDVTRIAASDPTLWVQILGANAEKVVEILHGVREDLNRVIGTLENPTAPGARLDLAQLISEGNAGQSRIPGKHGGPPQAYSWLTVLVDDTPGQIARLLTEIGEIGVNLEDLRLDHSSGQNVGMVEISVLPNKHELLIEALNDRGWRVLQ